MNECQVSLVKVVPYSECIVNEVMFVDCLMSLKHTSVSRMDLL